MTRRAQNEGKGKFGHLKKRDQKDNLHRPELRREGHIPKKSDKKYDQKKRKGGCSSLSYRPCEWRKKGLTDQ